MKTEVNIAKGAAGIASVRLALPKSRKLLPAALFTVFIIVAFSPSFAFADGGVHCLDAYFWQDSDAVSPKPHDEFPYIQLEFDKNVGSAQSGSGATRQDTAFIENNLRLVHLEKASGEVVSGITVEASRGRSDRRWLYVDIADWLEPLTEYYVVVEPGITAANGEDISTERYTFAFKTTAETKTGLSLFQNYWIVAGLLALVLGVAFQAVRLQKVRAS